MKANQYIYVRCHGCGLRVETDSEHFAQSACICSDYDKEVRVI